MKRSLHRRPLRGKPLLSLRPLSVSLLLSLVVVLHSVSSLDKSFDEESVLGQKRSPGYKQGRKQALKSSKEENDKPNDELLLSLIEKYLKKNLAEKQHKLNSHNRVASPRDSDSKCGIPDVKPKVDSRVVGGVEATPHSWPWQVSFRKNGNRWCGGSIFNSRWVITAAHCFTEGSTANYMLVLGEHNKLVDEGTEQEFKVEKIIVHEDYNSKTYDNDIALIRLPEDVQFNRNIKPICLPDHDVKDGTLCVATGWGDTKSTGDPNVLNQVYLPVVGNSQCNEPDWYNGRVKDTMICAGYPQGDMSICMGDSGGPLACLSDDKWKLFGLSSFVADIRCAIPNHPSVFARVTSYLEWIRENTK